MKRNLTKEERDYFKRILKDINASLLKDSNSYGKRCTLYEENGSILLKCITDESILYYGINNNKMFINEISCGKKRTLHCYKTELHSSILSTVSSLYSGSTIRLKSIVFDVIKSNEEYVSGYLEESYMEKDTYDVYLYSVSCV